LDIFCEGCLFNEKQQNPAVAFFWGMASYYRPLSEDVFPSSEALVAACSKCAPAWKTCKQGTRDEYIVQEVMCT
jgi:hypothetical protein